MSMIEKGEVSTQRVSAEGGRSCTQQEGILVILEHRKAFCRESFEKIYPDLTQLKNRDWTMY